MENKNISDIELEKKIIGITIYSINKAVKKEETPLNKNTKEYIDWTINYLTGMKNSLEKLFGDISSSNIGFLITSMKRLNESPQKFYNSISFSKSADCFKFFSDIFPFEPFYEKTNNSLVNY